jgi:hypothetical protein
MNSTRKLLAIAASLALLSILLVSFYAAGTHTNLATPLNNAAHWLVSHARGGAEGTAGWIRGQVLSNNGALQGNKEGWESGHPHNPHDPREGTTG